MRTRIVLQCLAGLVFLFCVCCNFSAYASNATTVEKKISSPDTSYAIYNEIVTVDVGTGTANAQSNFSGALLSQYAPKALDYLLKRTVKYLNKKSEEYVQEYQGYSGPLKEFWKEDPNDNKKKQLNLKEITITRYGSVGKDESVEKTFELAFEVKFPDNEPVLRLIPKRLLVSKTKAKRRRKDEDIDIDVILSFRAVWLDADKVAHDQIVASLPISFKKIKVGQLYDEDKFGTFNVKAYGIEKNNQEVELYTTWEDWQNKHGSEWFVGVPISTNFDGKLGNGTYSITAKIVEYDEYGERIKKVADVIDKYRGQVIEWIFKEDEK